MGVLKVKTEEGFVPAGGGGGSGEAGADGFSPIAAVTQTASGAVISVTDKSGTTTATVFNGKDGKDGYTPVKGVDYFDGAPGKDGVDGKDGAQGIQGEQGPKGDTGATGSQGPKGDKGDKGDTGATGATGATGSAGKNGADGYTPVRGVDYFTEADKVEIVQRVIESLGGNPIFGIVDENNNIVVSGDLPDGTYSVKYEMENGTKLNIGNLVIDTNVYYTVTNTLNQCTTNNSATKAVQGGSYSATITAKSGYELKSIVVKMGGTDISSTAVSGGTITIANVTGNIVITAVATEKVVTPTYTNLFDPAQVTADMINARVSNSKERKDIAGHFITPFIDVSNKVPFTAATKIYVKGANFNATSSGTNQTKIATYTSKPASGYSDGSYSLISPANYTVTDEGNGVLSISGINSSFPNNVKYMVLTLRISDSNITSADIQNVVITIDEPIG